MAYVVQDGLMHRGAPKTSLAFMIFVAVLWGGVAGCTSSTSKDASPALDVRDDASTGDGVSPVKDAVVEILSEDGPAVDAPTQPSSATSLREAAAAAGISVGTATWAKGLFEEVGYTELIAAEFDRVYTAGSAHGFTHGFRPELGVWRWERNDNVAQFALDNDLVYHAVQLVYKTESAWITDLDPTFVPDEMSAHITEIITHYQNKYGNLPILFNVVNESISAYELQDFSPWLWHTVLGESYITIAFTTARTLAPEARLYYNDNGNGSWGSWAAKWDRIQSLVQGFVDAGVPMDGVGFQLHQAPEKWPTKKEIIARFEVFQSMGLEVMVTELFVATDESFGEDEAARTEAQTQQFVEVVEACLAVPACKGLTFFGLTGEEWEHQPSLDPVGLFNADLTPRPVYYAVMEALQANGE